MRVAFLIRGFCSELSMSPFFTDSIYGYHTEVFGLTVIYRLALTIKKIDANLGAYGDFHFQPLDLALLMIINMHIALREWNGNAFLIESFLDSFCHIPVHIPVVVGFYPRSNYKIH